MRLIKDKNIKDFDENDSLVAEINRTIYYVTLDYENFRFNRAVARIRELTNYLQTLDLNSIDQASTARIGAAVLVQLLSPMAPHLAEELWVLLRKDDSLSNTPWPIASKTLLSNDKIKVGVQVNGKKRAVISLPKDHGEELARSLSLKEESVIRAIGNKEIKRIIVVKGKIVNIVV